MIPYLPKGWRNLQHISLDDSCYLALSRELGRGIVKEFSGAWFFIKNKGKKEVAIPLSFLEEVFCLYPIRKYYEDVISLRKRICL